MPVSNSSNSSNSSDSGGGFEVSGGSTGSRIETKKWIQFILEEKSLGPILIQEDKTAFFCRKIPDYKHLHLN